MSAIATPAGRRAPGFADHLVAYVATLAMTAVAGAALVMAARLAERLLGPPEGMGPVAVLWVFGINLMRAPVLIWPLVPVGAALFAAFRQMGLGGWLTATLIGLAVAVLVGLGGAATAADALIRLGLGGIVGLIWWKIMDLWTSRPARGSRSPDVN